MSSTTLIMAAPVLLLLAAIYLMSPEHWHLRPRRTRTWNKGQHPGQYRAPSYQSVSVVGHCSSARALTGRRFLSHQAPVLPLPGCSAATCKCKYVHYDDRRGVQEDRRMAHSQKSGQYLLQGNAERRRRRGRREEDMAQHGMAVT